MGDKSPRKQNQGKKLTTKEKKAKKNAKAKAKEPQIGLPQKKSQ